MKFLANENFPLPSIHLLKNAGYEVISIAEKFSGISDMEVIKKANTDTLIILTFDKDYGEIIFKNKFKKPPAVVFFRFKGSKPETAGILLIDLIENKGLTIENAFSVIEKEGVRQRIY
jgi:predicted nuclease of predicted toxin-antitoxin system